MTNEQSRRIWNFMCARALISPPKLARRGWGKLPLSPIATSLRTISTPQVPPQSAHPAVIAMDASGLITAFNSVAEKLLEYHAEDLIGTASPEIFLQPERFALPPEGSDHHETSALGFQAFAERVDQHCPEDEEWTFLRQDGTEVRALVSLTRMRDARSQTLGYVIIATPSQ